VGGVRGSRRALRARSPELARQEAWALLLARNLIAGLAALAGIAPGEVVFAAVLSLVRAAQRRTWITNQPNTPSR
jgi:hypothetical protein